MRFVTTLYEFHDVAALPPATCRDIMATPRLVAGLTYRKMVSMARFLNSYGRNYPVAQVEAVRTALNAKYDKRSAAIARETARDLARRSGK